MPNMIPIDQIVVPTSKWQITIPKKIREEVGLEQRKPLSIALMNNMIVMTPVIIMAKEKGWTRVKREKLLQLLNETRGIWVNDKDFDKRQKQRKRVEIEKAKKMRKAW